MSPCLITMPSLILVVTKSKNGFSADISSISAVTGLLPFTKTAQQLTQLGTITPGTNNTPSPLPWPTNPATAPDSGYVFGYAAGEVATLTNIPFQEIPRFSSTNPFFAYYEDVDVSFRAQLTGHKVYYKDAIAYHKQDCDQ